MKGMILAAGLGTRLKPWTDKHPKSLAIVNGKSLLQRNIEYFASHGIKDVIVNVHHFADQIMGAIEKNNGWGSNITISDETDEVLETGGGLKKAAWFLQDSDPFALMNADILTDLDLTAMVAHHAQNNPLATLATTQRETSRYFLFDSNNKLYGWKNEKTNEFKGAANLSPIGGGKEGAFSGIHIISPSIFSLITEQGKFSVVDVYLRLAQTETILSFDHSHTKFVDVGKPESIGKAENLFK